MVGGMKIQMTHKRFGSTNHYDYSNHKIYPQTQPISEHSFSKDREAVYSENVNSEKMVAHGDTSKDSNRRKI
jgi:hypothetical protein